MRIIARSTLHKFWERQPQAEQPLKAWFKVASSADWATPDDVRADYRKASFFHRNRVCFNIGGNKFRLVVRINYPYRIVYIRFVGTHREYDAIDVNTV
ncbi:MAG: type II toxin-antitoxin system HigB family toxin [Candidatus Omnitrophota bacterium]|jgi:mRNA interferase HigB|nr:MAG: type II toxin-antitoxin system HigB family toxin [Candidatus Omnitrophota bacterium]